MSPGTGSMSSCHYSTGLPQPEYSPVAGAQPFCGPGRASHHPPVSQDDPVRADVPRGVQGLPGAPHSSIPQPSGSIPAGIPRVPCSGAAHPGSPYQPPVPDLSPGCCPSLGAALLSLPRTHAAGRGRKEDKRCALLLAKWDSLCFCEGRGISYYLPEHERPLP